MNKSSPYYFWDPNSPGWKDRPRARRRVGRPKRSFLSEGIVVIAGILAIEQMAIWREQRARGDPAAPLKRHGAPSLSEAAYEKMARHFRLGSGRGLANAVSALRDWPYFGD